MLSKTVDVDAGTGCGPNACILPWWMMVLGIRDAKPPFNQHGWPYDRVWFAQCWGCGLVTTQSIPLAVPIFYSSYGCSTVNDLLPTVVLRLFYGCSTVVLICFTFTSPAITVGTVILRALDGSVRGHFVGWRSIAQIPARQASRDVPDLPPGSLTGGTDRSSSFTISRRP